MYLVIKYSVGKKNNYMSLVFFISILIVAQHVSGNHVPIIRSWRLRDVTVSCWYVPWLQEGCQDRLAGSASMDEFVTQCSMVCRSICSYIPYYVVLRTHTWTHYLLTGSDSLPAAMAQYQYVAIKLRSRQLLKMGTWLPEKCWATCKGEIKDNTKVTSSWFLIQTGYALVYVIRAFCRFSKRKWVD